MAPPKANRTVNRRRKEQTLDALMQKYANLDFVKYLVLDPAALPVVSVLIILAEMVINLVVIQRVPYTEIDWIAYMQECEGFLNGTTNYALLRGDTGPLVYPAAFVYIYSALYFITSHGTNIRLAQYIFAGVYLLQLWLVLRLYTKSRKVPPYVLVLCTFTSYRIHSIYILRLFNDPIAILFLYIALNLFMDQQWTLGSVLFSLAVGVKMNILLFAPPLLLFYISNLGLKKTAIQLAVCAEIQLLLGSPFLFTYPLEYLKGSFDLGRIFEHKWTVNYRFLPKDLFENKHFHLALLALHLILLLAFAKPIWTFFKSYVRLRELQKQLQPQLERKNRELKTNKLKLKKPKPTANKEQDVLTTEQKCFLKSFEKSLQKSSGSKAPAAPQMTTEANERVGVHFDQCTQLALLPFFFANFIGVACARSLHYQFYVWYFHTLPYLVWSTPYSLGLRCLILGFIEYCWNTYPSTYFSSVVLHICHLLLLVGVGRQIYQTTALNSTVRNMQQEKEKTTKGELLKNGTKLKAT